MIFFWYENNLGYTLRICLVKNQCVESNFYLGHPGCYFIWNEMTVWPNFLFCKLIFVLNNMQFLFQGTNSKNILQWISTNVFPLNSFSFRIFNSTINQLFRINRFLATVAQHKQYVRHIVCAERSLIISSSSLTPWIKCCLYLS